MFIHIPTGKTFENRKEAKKYYGQETFKEAVKKGEFTLHGGIIPDKYFENHTVEEYQTALERINNISNK